MCIGWPLDGERPYSIQPCRSTQVMDHTSRSVRHPSRFSTMSQGPITFSCTSRHHHYYNSDSESWTAQATTASGYCRGDWWYPSRYVIPSFLPPVSTNPLSRPDCLWSYTRFFPTHIPSPVYSLSLVANIGLCLFLFLVGLEIDTTIIRRNLRLSVTIAAAGITLPFGLGAVLAIPIYHHFIDSSQVSYPHFMLFTGVAYSITAFPVLCRILTELKLLDTTVGIIVLSAGVCNDIIGWTLLALSVALVNAGSGLTALWILLVCVGWTIFMLAFMR